MELPITSHILIAVSGGLDSTVLAHLLTKYGRRVGAKAKISLVHVNHGWRGAESDADALFVEELAEKWGVPCISRVLAPLKEHTGDSLEEVARFERKAIFTELAAEREALVLTAHHADDLAETVLWRLLTGTADTHGGGIAVRHGHELRPLLRVRKHVLMNYALEEKLKWREDRTNHEGRFLRSKMRRELMPVIEKFFARGVEHLAAKALQAQEMELEPEIAANQPFAETQPLALLGAAGIKARRAHWELIQNKLREDPEWKGELHLPGGWRLKCEARESPTQDPKRWVLEKI